MFKETPDSDNAFAAACLPTQMWSNRKCLISPVLVVPMPHVNTQMSQFPVFDEEPQVSHVVDAGSTSVKNEEP